MPALRNKASTAESLEAMAPVWLDAALLPLSLEPALIAAMRLSDEARCVEEQFVGIGDVFNIEQLHGGVGFWIEVLVHILQHVLDANLFSVAY